MNGKVIYLTGAPATGKSTLGKAIEQLRDDIVFISYSTELVNYINSKISGGELDDIKIREQSELSVTEDDVKTVDRKLISRCNIERKNKNIIIDSHPVTKEKYGFRITGFEVGNLQKLSPDIIICLYASPEIITKRIHSNSGGRPLPSKFELEIHIQAQASLAAIYGVLVGSPVYLIDSDKELNQLAQIVLKRCKLLPNRDNINN